MLVVVIKTAALLLVLTSCQADKNLSVPDTPPSASDLSYVLETSHEIREEANKIRGEAFDLMNRAFEMKEEAVELREETYSSRSELQRSLLETLYLINTHAVSTAHNIAEIKSSLAAMSERMESLEEKVGMLEDKIDSEKETMEEMQGDLVTVKRRQHHVISEVRLISLYKMSDQTSQDGDYRDSDLLVDGQFIFDKNVLESMQAYTKTDNSPGNELNIHLGGLFRIHRVKVWNVRFCCQTRFIGTRILADERMIGVALSAKPIYKFDVSEDDPTYARKITLHQELAENVHVLEVQVWGSGPYAADDLFD